MRSIRLLFGILIGAILLQGFGLLLALILIYQTTPQGVLARETFIGKVPGFLSFVRVFDRSLNFLYWGPRSPDMLPRYQITIDAAELQKIEDALPVSPPSPWYGNLFLTDESQVWVKGTFRADGEEYPVQMRVRGDIFNHWAYRKKSWRIRFPNDRLFRGMSEINLIIPEDRAWFGDLLNTYRAEKLGLLHPPMRFAQVFLNDEGPMLYVEVEHWTKEMVEKRERSRVNLYQTGGGSSYFQQWDDVFEDPSYWKKYTQASEASGSQEEVELLIALSQDGAHLLPDFRRKVESLFDIQELAAWYAHSLLAGSSHVVDHNLRLMFTAGMGRFEPVMWDVHLFSPSRSLLIPPTNALWREIFSIPEYRLAAYDILWKYVNDKENVATDLAESQRLRTLMERAAYRDPLKLPSNRTVHRDLNTRMQQVQANIDFIKRELDTAEVLLNQRIPSRVQEDQGLLATFDVTIRGVPSVVPSALHLPNAIADAVNRGEVQLVYDTGDSLWNGADTIIPLQVLDERDQDGKRKVAVVNPRSILLWPDVSQVSAEQPQAPHTHHRLFLIRRFGNIRSDRIFFPLELKLQNAVTGGKVRIAGEVLIDDRNFERFEEAYGSRSEFLRRNPAFRAEGERGVFLSGNPVFVRDIIVPSAVSLRIVPGTRIGMGSGVSLLSYAPVQVDGTPKSRIAFFASTKNPWGVFAILNAKEKSSIRWTEFSDGGEDLINGAFFSGMVAPHGSPITIEDTVFRRAHGDDGLNIKYIPADLRRLRFEENFADGIDIDNAPSGVLEDSTFRISGDDANGDGIDLSWSHVTVRNVEVKGRADKCISVGEQSTPLIQDAVLEGCVMGIAVKDGSDAQIERTQFIHTDIAISAYVKKPFFSSPSIDVRASTFKDNGKKTDILHGANVIIDGEIVNP